MNWHELSWILNKVLIYIFLKEVVAGSVKNQNVSKLINKLITFDLRPRFIFNTFILPQLVALFVYFDLFGRKQVFAVAYSRHWPIPF